MKPIRYYQLIDHVLIELDTTTDISKVGEQLHDQIHDQLHDQIHDQLHDQIHDQIRYQLLEQLANGTYNENVVAYQ